MGIQRLLPQPLDSGPHKLACLQGLHGPLIYFTSLLTQLDNLLTERRRYNNHSIFVPNNHVPRINP